jgi:hypothetical protein
VPTTTARLATSILLLALATPAPAAQVVFGKKLLIRNPPSGPDTNRVVHVAKDAAIALGAAGGAGDPQCSGASGGGGSVRITASGGAGDVTIPLPCAGWTTNASNTTYRYKDASGATCQRVIVRDGAVAKAVCKGAHVALAVGAGMAPIGVVTTLNTEEYVTEWAGEIVADGSDGVKFLAKNAPPPTTTSTTVGGATTTSTLPCACGASEPTTLTFTTAAGAGTCGSLTNANGTPFGQMACGDLFLGGGEPLPYLPTMLPHPTTVVLDVATCSGDLLTLGPTTSAETGSDDTCTSAGCLFARPLALPYVSGVDLSVCAVPRVTGPASGTVDCGTGATSMDLPLELALYLTQDAAMPCPSCSGGVCSAGERAGLACAPDLATSHDCPPDDLQFIGNLTVPVSLQTAAATWTATPATNDTGSEADQAHVFCGYCRDADNSTPGVPFQVPPQACWENGQPVGPACAQHFETCEQRNAGAFGPSGGNVRTISVTGMAPGSLADHAPHAATLAGIFCLPPELDSGGSTAAASLGAPGPGALMLNGTIQLQPPGPGETLMPVGGEFQVNTYTTNAQYPTLGRGVARAPDGRFVVAWTQPYGSNYGVAARRYDADGTPAAGQFQVTTHTTFPQYHPAIAMADDGSFVIVWERDQFGIFGRRFDATGAPAGGEFQVNAFTTNYSLYLPSVSSAADGSFVVVWYDANYEDVRGRRFDASGAALGPDFHVASYTTERQNRPDVAMAADGGFVVTWESYTPEDDHGGGIRARRFDATGAPLGPEFAVNTYTTNEQIRPAVSVAGDQGFVVAWDSWQQDGSGYAVQGRRYDATGTPLGPEFQVNAYTTGMQEYPDVAADDDRGFVVLWRGSQDGSYRSVHARRFDASGLATTGDLLVNTYTTGFQQYQSVATDGAGNYIVVWYTPHPADSADTVGQRFCVDEDSDGDCG